MAWHRVSFLSFRHWTTWVGLLFCGACAGFGSYLGVGWGHPIIGAAIGGGIGGFIFSQVNIRVVREHYSDELQLAARDFG